MHIYKPDARLLAYTPNPASIVEMAGRVCYQSSKVCDGCGCKTRSEHCDTCTEISKKFVRKLVGRGHESVIEHVSATVFCQTDRGVSHELVRHRLVAYSQESTRYVDYNDFSFICPDTIEPGTEAYNQWIAHLEAVIEQYKQLREQGYKPEVARDVLPSCTATQIVMTANMRVWRHVFRERLFNSHAHPKIRDLMGIIYRTFMRCPLAIFFGY